MNRNTFKWAAICDFLITAGLLGCLWLDGVQIDTANGKIKELEKRLDAVESPKTFLLPDEGLIVTGTIKSGATVEFEEAFADSDGDAVSVTVPGTIIQSDNTPRVTLPGEVTKP